MKTTIKCLVWSVLLLLGGSAGLVAQVHVPFDHNPDHDEASNCRGYAMGRAYNNYCPPVNLGEPSSIGGTMWEAVSYSAAACTTGDIIAWGGSDASEHAAYYNYTDIYGNVYVDSKEGTGNPPVTIRVDLITGHGNPTYIIRKNPVWKVKVQNDLNGSTSGTVKVDGTPYASPKMIENVHWNSSHSLNAVMDGQEQGTYRMNFTEWKKNEGAISTQTTVNIHVTPMNPALPGNYDTYKAVYKEEYDATFENHFVGVGTPGVIKVEGQQYTAPRLWVVEQDESVDAEAVNQNINGIAYTFTEWKVGTTTVSTTKAETFTPTGHTTYTAHFSGQPNRVANFRIDTDEIDELIHLLWTENPNPNVKYRIYRKPLKYGSESLRATVNHGTHEWTDTDYALGGADLICWDARSYYTVEDTEADAHWFTRNAHAVPKRMADFEGGGIPQTFSLSNYPNPFNPSTILTFGLPVASRVRLAVYDLQGREVCTYTAVEEAGYRQVVWDGKDQGGRQVSAGVYVYHLVAIPVDGGEPYIDSRKMVLLK